MQLLWGNANGGCRGVQAADAAAARAASTEATGDAFPAGWETSVGTRLANRRLQLGGGGAETLGQGVDELLIARLRLTRSRRRRLGLGRGYADSGATHDRDDAKCDDAAAE